MIPSYLKSHSIEIINLSKYEIGDCREEHRTELKGVALSGKILNTSQISTGVNVRVSDNILITVDDTADYVPFTFWDEDMKGWTVHPKDDYIVHNGVEMAIIAFEEMKPFGKIEFVELVCQRK